MKESSAVFPYTKIQIRFRYSSAGYPNLPLVYTPSPTDYQNPLGYANPAFASSAGKIGGSASRAASLAVQAKYAAAVAHKDPSILKRYANKSQHLCRNLFSTSLLTTLNKNKIMLYITLTISRSVNNNHFHHLDKLLSNNERINEIYKLTIYQYKEFHRLYNLFFIT